MSHSSISSNSNQSPSRPVIRRGGRQTIYTTTEARKQRNRDAQAAFRERRTEYMKEQEETIKKLEDKLSTLQSTRTNNTDECLMLRYKCSLLERILLSHGIDVQAELNDAAWTTPSKISKKTVDIGRRRSKSNHRSQPKTATTMPRRIEPADRENQTGTISVPVHRTPIPQSGIQAYTPESTASRKSIDESSTAPSPNSGTYSRSIQTARALTNNIDATSGVANDDNESSLSLISPATECRHPGSVNELVSATMPNHHQRGATVQLATHFDANMFDWMGFQGLDTVCGELGMTNYDFLHV